MIFFFFAKTPAKTKAGGVVGDIPDCNILDNPTYHLWVIWNMRNISWPQKVIVILYFPDAPGSARNNVLNTHTHTHKIIIYGCSHPPQMANFLAKSLSKKEEGHLPQKITGIGMIFGGSPTGSKN